MKRFLSLAGMVCCCVPAWAEEIDLGFNADALRIAYVHEFQRNALELDGGWLHHSDKGDVVHVGLNLSDIASSGSRELVAGLGGRIVYQDGDRRNQDGWSVPVGGFLLFTPQQFDRITLGAAAYFAPSVLSVGDAERYQDYTLRLAYNVMRQADVYAGLRYVKGEYDTAEDAYFDTGLHIGLTLRF
ncbi:MAG: YfaZ family outer membrane protein [Gammaproteobacteria bacterium]